MSERKVGCADCGTPYPFPLDTVLPNEQWKAIGGEEAGILCETCILRRAERLPAVTVARLYLEGLPIHGADKALEDMRVAVSNAALAEFEGKPVPEIDRMDLYRWWETLHARELEYRSRRRTDPVQIEAIRLAIRAVQHIEYEYPAEEATHAAARAVLEGMIEGGQRE